jgi:transcriptional regulator with XRE-family HTH domain
MIRANFKGFIVKSAPTPSLLRQTTAPSILTVCAQNILVARLAKDLTQQGLADLSGVSRATIAQLEGGTGDPKLSTIQQLAEAVGVTTAVLLLGKAELEALATLTTRTLPAELLDNPAVRTMRHLVETGFVRSRLEAAQIGVGLARKANLVGISEEGETASTAPTGEVGAAIGSFHAPGKGTLAGGHFALLLSTNAPAVSSPPS